MGGGEHHDYNIEGVGNDFIAATMDMSLVDKVIKINDEEAFNGARKLAKNEGIFAGSSSGAALAAAEKLIKSGAHGNIVIVLPDRGDRYFSKNLYEWFFVIIVDSSYCFGELVSVATLTVNPSQMLSNWS